MIYIALRIIQILRKNLEFIANRNHIIEVFNAAQNNFRIQKHSLSEFSAHSSTENSEHSEEKIHTICLR